MDAYQKSRRHLIVTLTLLTFFLVVAQFYALTFKLPFEVAASNKTGGFFAIYVEKLTQSWILWPSLIKFVLAHFFLQALLSFFVYYTTKYLVRSWPSLRHEFFLLGVIFWLLAQLTIYLWNSYLYPYSFYATQLLNVSLMPIFYSILLATLTVFWIVVALLALTNILRNKTWQTLLVISALLITYILLSHRYIFHSTQFRSSKQPNVIIIITDSLRPDYAVEPSGQLNNPNHVQKFIAESAYFSNAFALLGRSSPGLVSILTGNYPKQSGARFNLIPSKYLHMDHSLTKVLKARGYQTIFLADGRQFINIDDTFGFDQVVAAKSGVYDFIFTVINDTPLSNLISNTSLGQLLFPYTFANRNAYYTYLPHSFNELVKQNLSNKMPDKPVFLVAALTIAHWPYVWAKQPNFASMGERYQNSVLALDGQFNEFMMLLKHRGLLHNSYIVVLSDHGDSLGLPGDRITSLAYYQGPENRLQLIPHSPYSNYKMIGINTSTGHGTDLLSMTQLHTTLAFHGDGIKPQTISERVALIDIEPTILDLLKIPLPAPVQGISLKPILFGHSNLNEFNRPLFLETEIDIPLIDVTNINANHSAVSRLIEQYANLFTINLKTQQLTLRDDALPQLLTQKQRGIIDGDWLLAYFPGKNSIDTQLLPINSPQLKNCYYSFTAQTSTNQTKQLFCFYLHPTEPYFVLVNLKTKKWQILFANETSKNPIFATLLRQLRMFYSNEF